MAGRGDLLKNTGPHPTPKTNQNKKIRVTNKTWEASVVVVAFNPSTVEAEAGGSLWVQGPPGCHSLKTHSKW